MRKTPDARKIGLFTLAGIVFFLAILGYAVGDKLFVNKSELVVFYFEESVKGLNVGSPVVLNGVAIGKVTSISLDVSMKDGGFKIPVVAELTSFYDRKEFENKTTVYILDYLIKNGLRAKLTSQNMLTGQLMIELEFDKEAPAVFRKDDDAIEYLEIPTVLSQLGALTKDIQNLPLGEIVRKFDTLLETLNTNAPVILEQVAKFSVELNNPSSVVGGGNSLVANLNKAAQNISRAARSLRNFADYIERNPQALLLGKGKGNY